RGPVGRGLCGERRRCGDADRHADECGVSSDLYAAVSRSAADQFRTLDGDGGADLAGAVVGDLDHAVLGLVSVDDGSGDFEQRVDCACAARTGTADFGRAAGRADLYAGRLVV